MRYLVLISLASLALAARLSSPALADDKYSFHEDVHVGDKTTGVMSYEDKTTLAQGSAADKSAAPAESKEVVTATQTITAVKDGSATALILQIDPASYDIDKPAGGAEKKTTSPFAGKSITLTRNADETVSNDYHGNATEEQISSLSDWLNPDQDFFPTGSVAIGDTWDISPIYAKHQQLDAKDHLLAKCRLDSVKETADHHKVAQITVSQGVIRMYEGNTEADDASTIVLQVDMKRSQIVKSDVTGVIHYSTLSDKPGGQSTPTWDLTYTGHAAVSQLTPATSQPSAH